MLRRIERMARSRAACRCAGSDATAPAPQPAASCFDRTARFDPARARGRGLADTRRSLRTALRLGWQMEANWTDPLLFVIYSVAKPIASLLILVVMLEIIGAGGTGQSARPHAFVVVGSALWAFVLAGIAGLPGRSSTTASATGCSSTSTSAPATSSSLLLGRGVGAAHRRRGRDGHHARVRGDLPRRAVRHHGRSTGRCSSRRSCWASSRSSRSACCWPRSASRRARRAWSYPEAFAGRAVPRQRGRVPARGPARRRSRGSASSTRSRWWIEGMRQALLPGSPTAIGGAGIGVDSCHRNQPRRTARRSCSPCS